jgi:choline dehydrogenase
VNKPIEWDFIIAGAGSAGCVLAARLSEDPSCRVLLLEAGGADRSPLLRIPGFTPQAIESTRYNWHYPGAPDPSLGRRSLIWAGGRVLGGSASINGMVFVRGLPADFDAWAKQAGPGWGYEALLPYFRRLECWAGPPNSARGTEGPLRVRKVDDPNPAAAAILRAAVAAGVPAADDYNSGITEGAGLTQASQHGGRRCSTARAYLHPARKRPNLTVLTGTRVLALRLNGARCTGVDALINGQTQTLNAEREVVLAAGAIGSPKLLMLSGIGDPATLEKLGIEVRACLPAVGQNLNEHVNIKLGQHARVNTWDSQGRGLGMVKAGLRWLALRDGPAASPAGNVQMFIKTESALPSADIQVQILPIGFDRPEGDRQDGISTVISLCAPRSRGRIELQSADYRTPPLVNIALLDDEDDVARLMAACRRMRDIHAGATSALAGEYAPGPSVRTDADWRAFFRSNAALNWHPTSTCRIGDVVDPQLAVLGIAGLSVADASVFPTVTSGNTNAPVIALAEKAAELIAARNR